jgi:hypothetical protein
VSLAHDLEDLDEDLRDGAAGSRSGGRLGVVVLLVVLGLIGAALWGGAEPATPRPDGTSGAASATGPAPEDPRLLPWVSRGDRLDDEALQAAARRVWHTTADFVSQGQEPGAQVHTLFAGTVAEGVVVILQSVCRDGVTRLAQVVGIGGSQDAENLVLSWAEQVDRVPAALTITYRGGIDLGFLSDEPQTRVVSVLVAPQFVDRGYTVLRTDEDQFTPLRIRPDGVSEVWVVRDRPGRQSDLLTVAATTDEGAWRGVQAVEQLRPHQLIPDPAPVSLVDPSWGVARPSTPADILAGRAALASFDRVTGRVGVLGSTQTPAGRAWVVEVHPAAPGRLVRLVVLLGDGAPVVSQPQPVDRTQRAAAFAVPLPGGNVLALGVGAPEADVVTLGGGRRILANEPWIAAVVVPREELGRTVRARAFMYDGAFVGAAETPVPGSPAVRG